MIETLEAILEAAKMLRVVDFERLRESYNAGALRRWEAARDEARKRNASVKRKNKKLPRGQKLKPEKMPKRPRKITAFGDTQAVFESAREWAAVAMDWHAHTMPGRVLDNVAPLMRLARRVRRIADKAEPLKDCEFMSIRGEVWGIAGLIESLEDKAKEYIRRGGK